MRHQDRERIIAEYMASEGTTDRAEAERQVDTILKSLTPGLRRRLIPKQAATFADVVGPEKAAQFVKDRKDEQEAAAKRRRKLRIPPWRL